MEQIKYEVYAHAGVCYVFEQDRWTNPKGEVYLTAGLIHNSQPQVRVDEERPRLIPEHLVASFAGLEGLTLAVNNRNDLFPIANFLRDHFGFVGCRVAADHIRLQREDRTEHKVPFTIKGVPKG